ncbi:hypothetical protein EGW08_011568, partial [Elysia chlorotica]
DYNATSGLCGSYDSNKDNDFELSEGGQAADADAFLRSWRSGLQTFPSIADGLCPENGQNSNVQLRDFSQCQTADIAGTIQASDSFITCPMDNSFDSGADRTSALLLSGEEPVNCGFTVANFGFSLGPEGFGADTTETIATFPSEWSQEIAAETCANAVNNSVLSTVCNSSIYLNTDDYNNCVKDIKMTGLSDSSITLVQKLKERCRASYGQAGS